jgi:hypothetical protein
MMHRYGANVLRLAAFILIAAVAAASTQSRPPPPSYGAQAPGPGISPTPVPMDAARALGLWRSNFGPVKIDEDLSRGGVRAGAIHGVWSYQRQGQEVIGYFAGQLRGNVLDFSWEEPSQGAPLAGQGMLVFEQSGQRFSGRWWTTSQDRSGDWQGWRDPAASQPAQLEYPYPAPQQPQQPYPQPAQPEYPYPAQPQSPYPQPAQPQSPYPQPQPAQPQQPYPGLE